MGEKEFPMGAHVYLVLFVTRRVVFKVGRDLGCTSGCPHSQVLPSTNIYLKKIN